MQDKKKVLKPRNKEKAPSSTSVKQLVQSVSPTIADSYIAQLQAENPTIRSISLAGNDITEENIDSFAYALLGNQSVTYLAMFCVQGGNCLTGATLLSASAMSLTSLRTLKWSNIFDCGYAIQCIAKGLSTSKTLNRVILMDSKIKRRDVALIADSLKCNKSIETMCLECCGVTDEGAINLAKMAKLNNVLVTLSLSENEITDVGAAALLESIFDTKSIASMWTSNHVIKSFSRESTFQGNGMEQFFHVSPDLKKKILRILEINRNGGSLAEIGRQKMALHMEESFDKSWFKEIDDKVMPLILSWLGPTASFEILRNTPTLFINQRHPSTQIKHQDTHGARAKARSILKCNPVRIYQIVTKSFSTFSGAANARFRFFGVGEMSLNTRRRRKCNNRR